jgi:C-terminal processing protease CtpA/Prc
MIACIIIFKDFNEVKMKTRSFQIVVAILILCMAVLACAKFNPTTTPAFSSTAIPVFTEAPVEIAGGFTYSNNILTIYYVEDAVALVDMYGFVKRDKEWEIPVSSQTLGFLAMDIENMAGKYTLQLPAKPTGKLVDVDNNNKQDEGVQIFAVSYWPNLTGGPYSEGDDRQRGWPTYLASVITDTENGDEVVGGKLVVWAPDAKQQFPSGYGTDGKLFTADDPIVPIPAGYSIVDLDQTPFAIIQTPIPDLTLYEPKDVAIKNYSDKSYTEAFDELFNSISTNWAFNDVETKKVDWDALYKEIQPRIAEAEKKKDPLAFYAALHTFILGIPDGHTGISDSGDLGIQDFSSKSEGGYGFAIRELDNKKVIVTFVNPGGPAELAGLQVGAEVTEWNSKPIKDAIGMVEPYSGPFSLELTKRYQQTRYLLRAALNVEATLTFANPNGQSQTVKLISVAERDSLVRSSIYFDAPVPTYPVEFKVLDSGIGYIRINSNYDDLGLIIRLFEYALKQFQASGITNIIIDMRFNSGGNPLGLAGFFYDKEIILGQLEYYSEITGKFEPEGQPQKVLPNKNQYPFDKIAILVSPACASACEIESYGFSQLPNAIVVGMFPSAGVEAEVARGQYELPEGISIQIPTGRFKNPDGSLFLEGTGVVPTVKVPVTAETVLTTDDVVLAAAEKAISQR